jgi:hypothetical protein
MNVIHLFTPERELGHSGLWLRKNLGKHTLIAIPRLAVAHQSAIELAEGASLLSLFQGSLCDLDGDPRPVSVLSGHFELFTRGTPTLGEVICFVQGDAPSPGLAEVLRLGVEMLKETRGT